MKRRELRKVNTEALWPEVLIEREFLALGWQERIWVNLFVTVDKINRLKQVDLAQRTIQQ